MAARSAWCATAPPVEQREFLGEDLDGIANLVLGMAGGDEEPKARKVFWNRRVQDRIDVDAAAQQRVGQFQGLQRVAHDARDDRGVVAVASVDPGIPGKPQKQPRVVPQTFEWLPVRP
ncbi:hypothetical protein OH799_01470 [Nocardia sp. NBC_00881]|uniref:hypothetical protein n=1 Tax=Nocardia sp. NBC_00881 TaxID=2975995 RepID=UPI00386605E7|nr:hypothetical protein OH799_01470 [Nocardia sp. NBC_00881]